MVLFPEPQEMEIKEGSFKLGLSCKIISDAYLGDGGLEAATVLRDEFCERFGLPVSVTKGVTDECTGNICLEFSAAMEYEAYTLTVSSEGITIKGNIVGVFYGVQTLRQLIRNYGLKLPCLHINDYPLLKTRAFYHDITRGKIPTLKTLMELVDRAAFYKINQLQLYVEHCFGFSNQGEMWSGYDTITAEEILQLDSYCKKKHIELVPSLSTFGHLHDLLATETFGELREVDDEENENKIWLSRMRHHTLDVANPASLELVKKMIDEFVPLFSSDKFNICADETFDLGQGKNKERAEQIGKGRLYIDFLNEVIGHVKTYNKQVMFWGDIILHYPELLKEIPKDIIVLNWDYSPTVTDENTKLFSQLGFTQYLCPGVAGWCRFINDFRTGFKNITRMVSFAVKYKAEGILNTDWGDYGHLTHLSCSVPGMALGAGLSWNYKEEYNQRLDEFDEFERTISRLEYGDKSEKLLKTASQIAELSMVNWIWVVFTYYEIKGYLSQGDKNYMISDSNFKKCILDMDFNGICVAYRKIDKLAEELHLLSAEVYSSRKIDVYEMYIAAKGLALSHLLIANMAKYSFEAQTGDMIFAPSELAVKLEGWLVEFMSIWRHRNKESELFRVRDTIRGMCKVLRQYNK